MNKRKTGTEYEALACRYMEQYGFRTVQRNFRCRQGEIDVIGYHEGFLVFVEVKYRATDEKGTPEDAVNRTKQLRICRSADWYRMVHGYSDDRPVRYDVVAIRGEEGAVTWYRDAFAHIPGGIVKRYRW